LPKKCTIYSKKFSSQNSAYLEEKEYIRAISVSHLAPLEKGEADGRQKSVFYLINGEYESFHPLIYRRLHNEGRGMHEKHEIFIYEISKNSLTHYHPML